MSHSPLPLSLLPVESAARIERYLSSDPALRRFRELGMLPGSAIRVVRRAPMGDPIEVAIGSSLLSIRKEQAAMIEVTPLPAVEAAPSKE
ncbi:MAG: ferrous iron transport protein A [Verrucomicrobiae bacterium]|nr:ferrous iron transport protein A [Verrucomicrobiae bacterium]MCB1088961.1 ferrous iron transport protein A [Verrucomicrobiae bacterium]MCB1090181.1 ferrous iron transport protein A [Verrucomicrobiae bacterium]